MKIQVVRFKNLNSLTGEWRIDFTDPNFSSNGIFAIVGATGAGKSTILDAISLALYGRTPRLKQVSKSTNEIMSRQSGECFSEVEFCTSEGRFRAHWSQHRARKKSTGELQPPKHEFVAADSGKVLAYKLKDVAVEVINATGMDFEQFTRSMLLAQGDFSKFLQASSDERAPILEQITGTGIYSQISRQVHLMFSAEKQKLDLQKKELEGCTILSADEISQLEEKQKEASSEVDLLQKQLTATAAGLNWHLNLEKLASQETELAVTAKTLQLQWEQSSPMVARLKNAQQCQLLQGNYTHLLHLRSSQQEEKALLQLNSEKAAAYEHETKKLADETGRLDQHYQQSLQQEKKQKVTIQQVRLLDYELQKLNKETNRLVEDEKKRTLEIEQLTKLISNTRTRLLSRQQQLESLHTFLHDNSGDEPLIENFSGIQATARQLFALYRQQQKLIEKQKEQKEKQAQGALAGEQSAKLLLKLQNDEKNCNEKILSLSQQMKEAAPSGLSALFLQIQKLNSDLNESRENYRLLLELEKLQEKKRKTKENITDLKKRVAKQQETLSQTKELVQLQKTNVARQEKITLLEQKIAGFEKERTRLVPGEPCPLCGSPEHPFADTSMPQPQGEYDLLKREKEHLETLDAKSRTEEIAVSKLQQSLQVASDTLKEVSGAILENETELCKHDRFFRDSKALLAAQAKLKTKLHNALGSKEKAESIQEEILSEEKRCKELNAEINDIRERHQLQQRQQDQFVSEATQLHRSLELLDEEKKQLLIRLSKSVDIKSSYPFTSCETIDRSLSELGAKVSRYKKALSDETDLKTELLQLTSEIEQTSHQRTLQQEELAKLKNSILNFAQEKEEILQKRSALFGSKSPDDEEQRQQAQIEEDAKKLKEAQQIQFQKERELTITREKVEALLKSTDKRGIDLQSEEEHFQSLLQSHGFVSEAQFQKARLSQEEREQLQNRLQALESRRLETDTKLKSIREELQRTKDEQVTVLQKVTLVSRQDELNQQLSEVQQHLGALTQQIKSAEAAKEKQKEKQQLLLRQEAEFEYWAQLHTLIGSADGKKFRNFAQGLTFELMVRHANQTLDKMSDRYLLKRLVDSPLELAVIDAYQAGETRSTVNLSGGETFIISLALALGLSAMASKKVQIDSLFLDEGFGTLDEESLEIALDTLSSLQQRGKIIGIISHVPLLKERIDVQLHLTAGLDGTSTIAGPGVTRF